MEIVEVRTRTHGGSEQVATVLARTSVAAVVTLGMAVAAAVEAWRASKRLQTLIRCPSDIS